MNSLLKKLLMVALIAPTFAFAQVSVDKVVATVAGEPITAQEVQERININIAVSNQQAGKVLKLTTEQKNNIAQASLNELIGERVMLNKAKNIGVNVSESDVNTAINNMASSQNATVDQLKASILKRGGDKAWNAFNRDLKNELTFNALRTQEVVKKIQVSPEEIETFLASQKMGANNPIPKNEALEVRYIIAAKNTPASLKKIKAAQARIAKGESFETVGAAVTDEPEALTKPTYIALNDPAADAAVLSAVKNLPDGSVSEAVRAKRGVYLFKAVAHRVEEITLDKQTAMAKELLVERKADAASEAWYNELMENAKKNLVEIKN